MLLSEYQAEISSIIDRYSRTDLITTSELTVDSRSPKLGIIKGSIRFFDGSQLFFTEYIDCRYCLEKLNYSYHCQDADGSLLFRYDNAVHKPALAYSDHKHAADGSIAASTLPELSLVIEEAMERFIA